MHFKDCLFQATEFKVRGPNDGDIDADPTAYTVGAGTDCSYDWISIEGMNKVVYLPYFCELFPPLYRVYWRVKRTDTT